MFTCALGVIHPSLSLGFLLLWLAFSQAGPTFFSWISYLFLNDIQAFSCIALILITCQVVLILSMVTFIEKKSLILILPYLCIFLPCGCNFLVLLKTSFRISKYTKIFAYIFIHIFSPILRFYCEVTYML